jgi:hypothetical protein
MDPSSSLQSVFDKNTGETLQFGEDMQVCTKIMSFSLSLSLLCLFFLVLPTPYMFFSFILFLSFCELDFQLLCNLEVGAGDKSPGPRLCVSVSVLA